MKLDYFPDTDTLYIALSDRPSTESEDIADNVVADYDAAGSVVGIEIEHASKMVQLDRIEVNRIPGKVFEVT